MPDALTQDIIQHSVTQDDVADYHGKGVITFIMPYFWATPRVFSLPTDLPPYWCYQRDVALRSTILHESYWASAVGIAINKVASQSFDIESNGAGPRVVADTQQLFVEWGSEGYVPGMSKLLMDFLLTDNGAFVEIVRATGGAGSKILGVVHLDSLRCQRTGDPSIPVLFRDLKGGLHEMRDYQVIDFVDMPDPGYSWLGVGHCSAGRAYSQIYKMAGLERTVSEKITGSGAHQMAFIQNLSDMQLGGLVSTAESQAKSKGLLYYQGTILAGVMGDVPIEIKTLQLRGLPENFDRKVELDTALLNYANALGLVLTDLQPLSGQGLGTGKQAEVIEEKAQGRTIAVFRKQFTHKVNGWITPNKTTFVFNERDLRDEQQQAEVSLSREQVRASMIASGEITPAQGLQMAVDSDDAPREFLAADQTPDQSIGDEEKPEEITQEVLQNNEAQPPAPTPQPEPTMSAATPPPATAATKEHDALGRLAFAIELGNEAIRILK